LAHTDTLELQHRDLFGRDAFGAAGEELERRVLQGAAPEERVRGLEDPAELRAAQLASAAPRGYGFTIEEHLAFGGVR
jgi:hypothetical protein